MPVESKKVFLGGTANDSKWRDILIAKLKVPYFNPVVVDWTDEAKEEELYQRENCNWLLYVITPRMIGLYSLAEIIDDSNKNPDRTLVAIINNDIGDDGKSIKFIPEIYDSLIDISNMAVRNGAMLFTSLDEIAIFLNK